MAVAAGKNKHSKETPFDRYVGEWKGQIRHGKLIFLLIQALFIIIARSRRVSLQEQIF